MIEDNNKNVINDIEIRLKGYMFGMKAYYTYHLKRIEQMIFEDHDSYEVSVLNRLQKVSDDVIQNMIQPFDIIDEYRQGEIGLEDATGQLTEIYEQFKTIQDKFQNLFTILHSRRDMLRMVSENHTSLTFNREVLDTSIESIVTKLEELVADFKVLYGDTYKNFVDNLDF